MRQTEFEAHLGKGNICPNIETALERAVLFYSSHTLPGHEKPQRRTSFSAAAIPVHSGPKEETVG
jgi:hypothetical protein